jgi:hypothetical protein
MPAPMIAIRMRVYPFLPENASYDSLVFTKSALLLLKQA